jgi:type IV secretory pathway VirB10-like protein
MSALTAKPKTNRKLMGWVFAAFMAALVIYLIASKGTDLGQGQIEAKKAALAKKEAAKRYEARVDNPSQSSQDQMDAAKQALATKEASAARDAAAVPPPPMGPANLATSVAPPPDMGSDENRLELARLERARKAAGEGGGPGAQPAAPAFVVYQASSGTPGSSQPVLGALKMTPSGSGPDDAAQATATNPDNDPSVKAAQAKVDAYKAAQEEAATQKANGITSPNGEGDSAWLYRLQNSQIGVAKSIMAQRDSGKYWIAPGTVINAVVLSAVDTRLPGQIVARVTQATYDSRYGRYMVIPAGSVLQGQYNSQVKDGQRRVLMAFDTLVTPAGGEVPLGNMTAGDALGRAGLAGTLHTHFFKRMGIATLLAVEAVGMDRLSKQTQVVAGSGISGPPPVSSGGQIIVDAANQELKEQFSLGPNITIPAGAPMTIVTTGGIDVPPLANAR